MFSANFQVQSEGTIEDVYLGLGGNIGDTCAILDATLDKLLQVTGIEELEVSSYYLTPPISDIPQEDYVNAVCRVRTFLDVETLFGQLQMIEKELGKVCKPKNAPRMIDIDILFYGKECCNTRSLSLPHPRWKERLFVLFPLAEIAPVSWGQSIDLLIGNFTAKDRNSIVKLNGSCICA